MNKSSQENISSRQWASRQVADAEISTIKQMAILSAWISFWDTSSPEGS